MSFYKDPIETAKALRLKAAIDSVGGEEAIREEAAQALARHYIREGLNKGSWMATESTHEHHDEQGLR